MLTFDRAVLALGVVAVLGVILFIHLAGGVAA